MIKIPDAETSVLEDCIETAKHAILSCRYPYGDWPTRSVTVTSTTTDGDGNVSTVSTTTQETYVEDRYLDLQYRIALDLYNRQGAEGELAHKENGIDRTFDSSWISEQLLREITPFCGVTS
ncbi:MAG: hypothetical protein K6C08_16100 [Oscillospiraceae bacterium]|nr:hypothetical protein [Oscillospiraceae bacterium]